VQIKDGTRVCIDQGRRFQRSYVAIRAIDVVTGCRFAVEKRGIQGTVLAGIASGRRPVEQLAPDTSWHPLERPPQRRGCRELDTSQLQDRTNSIHLAGPFNNFFEGCAHVNPQKMQREMLLAGKSVASRVTHHRRGAGSTALLSERRRLLNEAEEDCRHISSLRFASTFRATLSARCLRVQ
jgi:hypothetical protein